MDGLFVEVWCQGGTMDGLFVELETRCLMVLICGSWGRKQQLSVTVYTNPQVSRLTVWLHVLQQVANT